MTETPEQAERRLQRERQFADLTREERGIKLQRSWAREFYLLRRRDFWYHVLIASLLIAFLTLQVVPWLT